MCVVLVVVNTETTSTNLNSGQIVKLSTWYFPTLVFVFQASAVLQHYTCELSSNLASNNKISLSFVKLVL